MVGSRDQVVAVTNRFDQLADCDLESSDLLARIGDELCVSTKHTHCIEQSASEGSAAMLGNSRGQQVRRLSCAPPSNCVDGSASALGGRVEGVGAWHLHDRMGHFVPNLPVHNGVTRSGVCDLGVCDCVLVTWGGQSYPVSGNLAGIRWG